MDSVKEGNKLINKKKNIYIWLFSAEDRYIKGTRYSKMRQ